MTACSVLRCLGAPDGQQSVEFWLTEEQARLLASWLTE